MNTEELKLVFDAISTMADGASTAAVNAGHDRK